MSSEEEIKVTESPDENNEPETEQVPQKIKESVLRGLTVCPGVAWGSGIQLMAGDLEIPQFPIDQTDVRGEIQPLRMAAASAVKQLE